MELFPSHITVNGQQTEVSKLIKNKSAKTGWEYDWLNFLEEWYNNHDFIEVQTSGSTGAPKNIQLKKDFVAASALRTIRFFKLEKGDKVLHCLPSQFIAGKLMVVRALIGELDLYPIDPSSGFEILTSGPQFKFAAMVINQVTKCLGFVSWNLEFLLLGGSAIPAPLVQKLQDRPTICYSSYAMTETATHIALRQLNGKKANDYYQCLEDVKVSLNEATCLRIEMPGLGDGFIQTNDLAELKDNKHFKILGRADNVIISGGIKFSPEQIEEKLEKYLEFPFLITSSPDDQLGEKIVLVIEGKENQEILLQLETICRQTLAKYERPREIRFIDVIPKTKNNKPDRKKLYKIIN